MFDILSRLGFDLFLKRICRDLLNKCDTVIEKIVDYQESMECMRCDPVIYVCISKDLKIT